MITHHITQIIVAIFINVIIIVTFLITAMVKILKGSRAMQLVKGIIFLILITMASSVFHLKILQEMEYCETTLIYL